MAERLLAKDVAIPVSNSGTRSGTGTRYVNIEHYVPVHYNDMGIGPCHCWPVVALNSCTE
jgi:hypothetical protein